MPTQPAKNFNPSMSIQALIQACADQLTAAQVSFGHGTTNAFDEAAWLVLWQLKLPLDALDSVAAQSVTSAQQAQVEQLIEKRITSRQPAAYLTQEAWLQGVPFYIDARSIVPRSLIAELLADGSIDPWLNPSTQQVLDLCTGNGSLAILAAMTYPDVRVDAADISLDALAVAHINVAKHGLQNRITLIPSDGLKQLTNTYDLIICNPPYVNQQSMQALPQEYLAEPRMALDGGADGMDFIRQLLSQVASSMNPEAVLVLEIGNERDHFENAFPELPVFWLTTSAGEDQVLLITQAALSLNTGKFE